MIIAPAPRNHQDPHVRGDAAAAGARARRDGGGRRQPAGAVWGPQHGGAVQAGGAEREPVWAGARAALGG